MIVKNPRPRVPKWLSTEQTRDLLAATPAEHAGLTYFLAATGCRIRGAVAVYRRDIAADESGQICVTSP